MDQYFKERSTNEMKQIGVYLRARRQAAGISQTEFGHLLGQWGYGTTIGTSQANISAIENGNRLTLPVIGAYARVLNTPEEDLVRKVLGHIGSPYLGAMPLIQAIEQLGHASMGDEELRLNEADREYIENADLVTSRPIDRWRDVYLTAVALVQQFGSVSPGQGDQIIFSNNEPAPVLRDALEQALENGWSVTAVYHPETIADRDRVAIIAETLGLVAHPRKGRFTAQRLLSDKAPESLTCLVMPRKAAMIFFSRDRLDDTAFFWGAADTATKQYVALIEEHALRLCSPVNEWISASRHRNLRTPPGGRADVNLEWAQAALRRVEFNVASTRGVEKDALRVMLMKDGFSTAFIDPDIKQYQAASVEREREGSAVFTGPLVEAEGLRRERMLQQIRQGLSVQCLLSDDGLKAFCGDGIVSRDDFFAIPLTAPQRRAVLAEIVGLMRDHPNLEIGILRETPPFFALITEKNDRWDVFLETFQNEIEQIQSITVETDVTINDDAAARVLALDFALRWSLPSTITDRRSIMTEFEKRIETITD